MPINLSVKNLPDSLAESLRRRAKRHHRSLQGELLAILQAVVAADAASPARPRAGPVAAREGRMKTAAQLFGELSGMGTGTPAESAAIIRKSRWRTLRGSARGTNALKAHLADHRREAKR